MVTPEHWIGKYAVVAEVTPGTILSKDGVIESDKVQLSKFLVWIV